MLSFIAYYVLSSFLLVLLALWHQAKQQREDDIQVIHSIMGFQMPEGTVSYPHECDLTEDEFEIVERFAETFKEYEIELEKEQFTDDAGKMVFGWAIVEDEFALRGLLTCLCVFSFANSRQAKKELEAAQIMAEEATKAVA